MPNISELTTPDRETLAYLSALALRSKAHWGYDADFINACRPSLTLTAQSIGNARLAISGPTGQITGFAQLSIDKEEPGTASLDKLFIDPPFIGSGQGKHLMLWAIDKARKGSAHQMLIEADPDAAPFYQSFGATRIGEAPSEAIPGRLLPLLRLKL